MKFQILLDNSIQFNTIQELIDHKEKLILKMDREYFVSKGRSLKNELISIQFYHHSETE